jgi:hypothetical protein
MPIKPVLLEFNNCTGMDDRLDAPDRSPNDAFVIKDGYARDGMLWPRPGISQMGSTTGRTQLMYQFITTRSTAEAVSQTIAIVSGELYVYNWSTKAWTKKLATADFTSAGITFAVASNYQIFAATYNGYLILHDSVHVPFQWDGTPNGGLTNLANAPIAFGRPTVYYAKLFFILNSDQTTIRWSEENDATTGYVAGGFNNTWTLTQTISEPLTNIIGTNEGLYYFRQSGIGVIRGSVTPDFTTTGVHDAVSHEVGAGGFRAATYYNGYIWFSDIQQRPWRFPLGGELEPIWKAFSRMFTEVEGSSVSSPTTTLYWANPFNIGEFQGLAPAVGNAFHNSFAPWRNQDFMLYNYYGWTTGSASSVMVFSLSTGKALGWWDIGDVVTTTSQTPLLWPIQHPGSGSVVRGDQDWLIGVTATNGASDVLSQFDMVTHFGQDLSTAYTPTFVVPMLGKATGVEYQFDQLTVTYYGVKATSTMSADYVTSIAHYSTQMATSVSISASDTSTAALQTRKRVVWGLGGIGGWIRPRLQFTALNNAQPAIESIAVLAYPSAADPGMTTD